jgi:DNA polymerase-3 subunit beta
LTVIESTPAVDLPEILVSAYELKQALTRVKPYLPARGAMLPVLSGCLLTVVDGRATLTATNLDVTCVTPLPGACDHEGSAVLPFKVLSEFVASRKPTKTKPGEMLLSFRRTDDALELTATSGAASTSMRCTPATEWPRLVAADTVEEFIEFDVAAAADVALAASTDDNRPIITGVLFEEDRAIATDSYRLHLVTDLDVAWPGEPALVPRRAVLGAHKLGATRVARTGGPGVVFDSPDGTRLYTRLIQGEFPNYRGLIPNSYPIRFDVPDPDTVRSAINDVRWAARNSTPVRLASEDGKVTLTAITQDVGEATSDPHIEHAEGPGIVAAFNPEYMDALFTGLDSDGPITFGGIDALKPWILNAPRRAGGNYVRLVMPVRCS